MAGGELSAKEFELGRPCPKCGYVRVVTDTNPVWQCPKCQIAYAKYIAATPLASRLASTGRRLAGEAAIDRSAYALIAANVVAAAIALAFKMTLRDLMLVYWAQSLVIGISFFIRMASLREYSTDEVDQNDQPLQPVAETKWRYAVFFLLHYGFFHMVYFVFIAFGDRPGVDPVLPGTGLWLCTLVFALNHGFSLVHNIRQDRLGKPNLSTLMMMPYARIAPMHITILIGGVFFGGAKALAAFIVLKTLADVFMHTLEHSVLRTQPLLHKSV